MMKRAAVAVVLVHASTCGIAAPAPHCEFAGQSVVMCSTAKNAAAAWHLYGRDIAAITDTHNQALIQQAGCQFARGEVAKHKVLELRLGRVATQWGTTRVASIVMDGRDLAFVADGYLVGTCEWYSSAGAKRDERPLGTSDPTPFAPLGAGGPDAPKFEALPIGRIGVAGDTFP